MSRVRRFSVDYLASLRNFAMVQGEHLRREISLLRMKHIGPQLRQCQVNGFSILVDAAEDVGRRIYLDRNFEAEESKAIMEQVFPGALCFDIGANIGYFTLLMAQAGATVHAFEPVPLNFHLLNANVSLNRFSGVMTNQIALSDSSGTAQFFVATDGAYSSFVNTERKNLASVITVRTTTLDEYCRDIERIDCMKIDVEGGEAKVIHGGRNLFSDSRRRPRFILMEQVDAMLRKQGSSAETMLQTMANFGYRSPRMIDENLALMAS